MKIMTSYHTDTTFAYNFKKIPSIYNDLCRIYNDVYFQYPKRNEPKQQNNLNVGARFSQSHFFGPPQQNQYWCRVALFLRTITLKHAHKHTQYHSHIKLQSSLKNSLRHFLQYTHGLFNSKRKSI